MKIEKIKIGDQEIDRSKLHTVNIDGHLMPIDLFINIMVIYHHFNNIHCAQKTRIEGNTLIFEANVK